jgi:hypothetical protein
MSLGMRQRVVERMPRERERERERKRKGRDTSREYASALDQGRLRDLIEGASAL